MFVPLDAMTAELRPAASQFSESDWRVLARSWYPVAVDGDVEDKPLKGKLLDVELVIYRVAGEVAVALDICPHRHIRLSAGTIEEDRLVCPFHGLAFDGAGRCVKVPALGRDAKLPKSYRLHSVRAEVRYGLVWACLDNESDKTVPVFPRADEVGIDHLSFATPHDWPVSAAHQVENYVDLAHLPWVHEKTIGGGKYFAPSSPRIVKTPERIEIYSRSQHTGPDGVDGLFDYLNAIYLPFNVYTHGKPAPNSDVTIHEYEMWDLAVPISAHECRVFWISIVAEPSGTRASQEPAFGGDVIREEDLRVLRELARADYPLDERGQIHLPVDNISAAYRKGLRGLGLGR